MSEMVNRDVAPSPYCKRVQVLPETDANRAAFFVAGMFARTNEHYQAQSERPHERT